jgi:hypothetical protein
VLARTLQNDEDFLDSSAWRYPRQVLVNLDASNYLVRDIELDLEAGQCIKADEHRTELSVPFALESERSYKVSPAATA